MRIQELDHLRNDPRIKFKEELVDGVPLTIVSYMIADASLWRVPNAIECRGITFDQNGYCVSRPFEKFFSIGENEYTQLHCITGKVEEVFEKRDGSMVHPVFLNDQVFFKTKKSFYSDVAVLANQRAESNVIEFCKYVCKLGYTPIFEFTCKEFPIVLSYDSVQPFTLLAIRHNVLGKYIPWFKVVSLANSYAIPVVDKYSKSINDVLNDVKNLKNFEGYVLTLTNHSRVKIKTEWYLANHRLKTAIRTRDIAEMVVNELVDDIKILASAEGLDLAPILAIEQQVVRELADIQQQVSLIVQNCKQDNLSQKEAALTYNKHPFFGLVMKEFSNKEPNYKEFWKKRYLSSYDLKCVYNENF